jgi:hypothetical protein
MTTFQVDDPANEARARLAASPCSEAGPSGSAVEPPHPTPEARTSARDSHAGGCYWFMSWAVRPIDMAGVPLWSGSAAMGSR